ncbi:hypothetical protein F4677DRAFT_445995 [Hypoxylon crocopeplum]|nr:hypothetical protein F4677DRAFT_445995 [Hypoxylon crocopeplum]
MTESSNGNGLGGRVRRASTSLMNANPQLGMWQATGTAIAQAPNLTELRVPELSGGIEFNAQGHSARTALREPDGDLVPVRTTTAPENRPAPDSTPVSEAQEQAVPHLKRGRTLREKYSDEPKEGWGPTIVNGLRAFWKFFCTLSGFCIIIYFLNIVAWGAMLFFLLLDAAPAMDYPNADDNNSPRKKWLEIDSQILNALFCVTGFGLAPWRFRDLYFLLRAVLIRDKIAMQRLAAQNRGWFRPPLWARDDLNGSNPEQEERPQSIDSMEKSATTFTGNAAPPTALWKLGFNICMMVLNTLFQVVLSYFMWAYNRLDRPTWATGTFIGLGCGVSAFAGVMSWWEGRKVKKIEGPELKIIDKV